MDKRFGSVFGSNSSLNTQGQSVIYFRHYTQGLGIKGVLGEEMPLTYDLALTQTAVSSFAEAGEFNTPSLIGRITFQPGNWIRAGLSFSHGNYLIEDEKQPLRLDRNDYWQTAYALFLEGGYGAFNLASQFTFSKWKAPLILPPDDFTRFAFLITDVRLSTRHFLSEITYDLPFWIGSYVGLRYELMRFFTLKRPENARFPERPMFETIIVNPGPFARNLDRIEWVIGKRINRFLRGKISYLMATDGSVNEDWRDNVFTIQLTTLF